jgi:hypothetical protein
MGFEPWTSPIGYALTKFARPLCHVLVLVMDMDFNLFKFNILYIGVGGRAGASPDPRL